MLVAVVVEDITVLLQVIVRLEAEERVAEEVEPRQALLRHLELLILVVAAAVVEVIIIILRHFMAETVVLEL